jgi:hypothetical protein
MVILDTEADRYLDRSRFMEPRMSHLLANLADPAFFESVSRGLELITKNVAEIDECAEALVGSAAGRGRNVLRAVAAEEAAKYLILLDAVRCPRIRQQERVQQLKRFNRHLAKGIYAEVVDIRPADYAEVLNYIKGLRQAYYLDGPNDVDWIFRNSIEANREQALYVDYIRSDDGTDWFDPTYLDDVRSSRPAVIDLIEAMQRIGFGTAEGLGVVAAVWRNSEFEPSTPFHRLKKRIEMTISDMIERGLGSAASDGDRRRVAVTWPFPLWEAELEKVDVDRRALRDVQARWSPT